MVIRPLPQIFKGEIQCHALARMKGESSTCTGCPHRSYKVLKGLIFVFPLIKLSERSYFLRDFVLEVL